MDVVRITQTVLAAALVVSIGLVIVVAVLIARSRENLSASLLVVAGVLVLAVVVEFVLIGQL